MPLSFSMWGLAKFVEATPPVCGTLVTERPRRKLVMKRLVYLSTFLLQLEE